MPCDYLIRATVRPALRYLGGELRVRRFTFWECIIARACVFVDGENFRHSLIRLFEPTFRAQGYLPRNAKWGDLFDWVVSQAASNAYRVRTYWYVIEHLDCSPYRLERLERDIREAERVIRNYQPYAHELGSIVNSTAREERVRTMVTTIMERRERMHRRFDGWTAIQNAIARTEEAIEFRRAGGIRYNLFDGTLGSEKAVDVNLACDMVALKDIYDVAVIFSGDQDYVPAVRIVKNAGKRVVNVSFRARNGSLLPGGARRLNETADRSLIIDHADLAGYFNLPVP